MQETNPQQKKVPVKMLTKKELHEVARERVSVIAKEFTDGFHFLEKYPRSVTFFGGARFPEDNVYYMLARSIAGRIVREMKYAVVSGGGPGIMEAANRGAFENNGNSLGLTIELPKGQATNSYITHALDFYYFFARKVCLGFASEAYLIFPGGLGTLDEAFEILTLIQTGKIEKVPVVLVGSDFWKPIETLLREVLLSRGTIDETDFKFYTITDDEDEIMRIIKHAPVRNGLAFNHVESATNHRTSSLLSKHCESCEGKTKPYDHIQNEHSLEELNHWVLVEDKHIEKTLKFKNFAEAMHFINTVAEIAEKEGHHPDLHIFEFNKVRMVLSTHAIEGLSENDYILAAKIDEVIRGLF